MSKAHNEEKGGNLRLVGHINPRGTEVSSLRNELALNGYENRDTKT